MNVHADILFLTHKRRSFSLGWRCEQSQPIAKVGAFLYCVRSRYYANYYDEIPVPLELWETIPSPRRRHNAEAQTWKEQLRSLGSRIGLHGNELWFRPTCRQAGE